MTKFHLRRAVFVALFAITLAGALGGAWLTVALRTKHAPEHASPTTAHIGGPFSLFDTSGETVTDASYRGKWLLIYFGYTACPDACPTALNNLSVALVKLGPKAASLRPLFITVDPERDTPYVMANYLKSFNPSIVGLTGNASQIDEVTKAFRVYVAPQKHGGNDYLVDHSAYFYVIGPDGKFVNVIAGDEPGDRMAEKLRSMITQAGT